MVEPFLFFAALGYLAGSIPFGLLLTRLAGYGDIRAIGSGNIGATNVLRTGNKKLALLTLLLDGGKGTVAVLIAHHLTHQVDCSEMRCFNCNCIAPHTVPTDVLTGGLFAVIGHLFPVWLKFKGGKGVATTFGVLLALSPLVGIASCAIWLGMAFAFRYSSLAALTAVLCAPPVAWMLTGDEGLAGACSILALLVWIKHRANIRRLIEGNEPKIGKPKS